MTMRIWSASKNGDKKTSEESDVQKRFLKLSFSRSWLALNCSKIKLHINMWLLKILLRSVVMVMKKVYRSGIVLISLAIFGSGVVEAMGMYG